MGFIFASFAMDVVGKKHGVSVIKFVTAFITLRVNFLAIELPLFYALKEEELK